MYPLTLELLDFLQTDQAQRVLKNISSNDVSTDNALSILTRLRKTFTPEQAAVILDQVILRRKARKKFKNADRLYFTEEALQQSTSYETASYHADIFKPLRSITPLADLGCGLGGDTLAFAEQHQVIAVERDPIRCRLAQMNIDACGYTQQVDLKCADWTKLDLNVNAGYIDPARRISSSVGDRRRVYHLNEMEPAISTILTMQKRVNEMAVKVSPGIHHNEVPSQAEVSFISLSGKMKEALLCFGQLRTGAATSAVLLPGRHVIDSQFTVKSPPVRQPETFLFEPDVAVIRAGLVQHLATMINAAQIDSQIAYLTGDQPVTSPFVKVFYIYKHGPFNLKSLNRWLREKKVGQIVIKKRGSPIDVDQFKKRLHMVKGGAMATIILTRVLDKPWMLLTCQVSTASYPVDMA